MPFFFLCSFLSQVCRQMFVNGCLNVLLGSSVFLWRIISHVHQCATLNTVNIRASVSIASGNSLSASKLHVQLQYIQCSLKIWSSLQVKIFPFIKEETFWWIHIAFKCTFPGELIKNTCWSDLQVWLNSVFLQVSCWGGLLVYGAALWPPHDPTAFGGHVFWGTGRCHYSHGSSVLSRSAPF